ncbi:hypothetical protein ACFLIM_48260 [Nonomuraea sp. M3C6]|uniref:Secreted protein n=1 Tax=Nonomuraea marmarensis TaxID=3351344 RepID=A0ABW7AUC1_9ACTN
MITAAAASPAVAASAPPGVAYAARSISTHVFRNCARSALNALVGTTTMSPASTAAPTTATASDCQARMASRGALSIHAARRKARGPSPARTAA